MGRWDFTTRNGIKFALAGTVSLLLALLLRLDEPQWAVTTAFVVSMPKFVGAIGEKMVLRILGAIAGAVIGCLLVEGLAQTPGLFLLAMGVLVSSTTALNGGALAPYGFRQMGYTATLVAAQGMVEPALARQVGLARCEEICLGIVVTMLVTTLLWPRYARDEFQRGVRDTLGVLAKIFREQMGGSLPRDGREAGSVLEKVGGSLSKLRDMIRLGSMESRAFHSRKPEVDEIVAQLGALSTALSNFGRTLPTESIFQQFIEGQAAPLHEALTAAMERMADPLADDATRRRSLAEASKYLEAYHARLVEFRRTGAGSSASVDESLDHAGYALSLHEIHHALGQLCDLLPQVEQTRPAALPVIHFQKFAMPGPDWIKAGLRGGFTVVLGLALLRWLKLPGGEILVIGLYLYTALSMNSPDRKGDLGVLKPLILALAGSALFFGFLLLIAPLLPSDATLFLVVGAMMFFAGYCLEKGLFSTFDSLVCLLLVSVFVGLHRDQPVTPQDIASPILALAIAAVLSAVIRRFVWPSLPQKALRTNLGQLIGYLEKITASPDVAAPIGERAAVALRSADGMTLVGVLEKLGVLDSTKAGQYRSYLRHLARLGGHLMATAGATDLPQPAMEIYAPGRALLLAAVRGELRQQRHAVERMDVVAEPAALPAVREWTPHCRRLIREHSTGVLATYLSLGLLYRIEQLAVSARDATREASSLRYREDLVDHPWCHPRSL